MERALSLRVVEAHINRQTGKVTNYRVITDSKEQMAIVLQAKRRGKHEAREMP